MSELLIGCGSRRDKIIAIDGSSSHKWNDLVTLDHNADHKPDFVWDLEVRPLPFADETFHEIHAYEVLEHLGNGQGDWKSWFSEWSEWYRLLKPGGLFCGTCPAWTSPWLWGDPSHRRAVQPETMVFLNQPEYTKQIGKTPMSDFRFVFKGDFDIEFSEINSGQFYFILRAIKPSRITS